MIDRVGRHGEVAQKNWAAALQTYRTALNTYRKLLEVRAERAPRADAAAARVELQVTRTPRLTEHRLEELTPREQEVACLIARGFSNRDIADALVVTRGTVANHVAHILGKLGATNRTQIATRVLEAMPGEDSSQS